MLSLWLSWAELRITCFCPTSSQWRLQPKWQTMLTCWCSCENRTARKWQRLNLECVHWMGIWQWVWEIRCLFVLGCKAREEPWTMPQKVGIEHMVAKKWLFDMFLKFFTLWCKRRVTCSILCRFSVPFGLRRCFFLCPPGTNLFSYSLQPFSKHWQGCIFPFYTYTPAPTKTVSAKVTSIFKIYSIIKSFFEIQDQDLIYTNNLTF